MKLTEDSKEYFLEGIVECTFCRGTGLYNGFAERDGARVICDKCKGTGKILIEHSWAKFTGRKLDKEAKRVYTTGMGYAISDKDVITKEGKLLPFSKYGCSYENWLKGIPPRPSHARDHERGGIPLLHTQTPDLCRCFH